MRNPTKEEKVVCPDSHNKRDTWSPEKVWDSKSPDGKPIIYGTLKSHTHRNKWFSGEDCERTGHAVPVITKPSKDKPDLEKQYKPIPTKTTPDYQDYGFVGEGIFYTEDEGLPIKKVGSNDGGFDSEKTVTTFWDKISDDMLYEGLFFYTD